MNSIKVKLIVIYAAVILVVMIVSGSVMLFNMRQMEINRTEEELRDRALSIYEEIIRQYDRDAFINAPAWLLLGQGRGEYNIQGKIISDGIVIAPEAFIGMRLSNRAIAFALAGEERAVVGPGPDISGAEHPQWVNFAMSVEREGENFIIHTRVSTDFINESLSTTAFTLVIQVLASIVLTLVLWFFLGDTITKPIINLSRHTKAISTGDFSKIEVKSKDEIGQLSHNFNQMAHELQNSLISVTSEKNKSVAILQNTAHGVLAYDAEGNLTHANNASAELLSSIDIQNYNLQSILGFLGFVPENVYNLKPEEIGEVTYQNNDYFILASVTSYTSQSEAVVGYIIVLQDVSRQMKLDNMRKEFVANVSHELRTPLTSIRTYAETLMEGAIDDKETAVNFLKVIDEEAQRMSLLVTDLLELSRIDSKQAALEMDVVDLVAMLRLSVRQSQFLASTKNQLIKIEAPDAPCFIEANASRINQVISNILSNAIKYSSEDTTIKVTMETTEKYYRIFVQDQGMGIPQESLGRIFERFYRVDKARARAMGGTGLGLAIVKEIMEEHGGRVHASSQMGEGTTMVLRFNKYNP
jgi:two-component system sensor histidine kinase VicK